MLIKARISYTLNLLCLWAVIAVGISACGVIPKDYPKNTAFVFDYNINVEGANLSNEEKYELETGLKNQLDDSIKVRTVNKFWYKGLNRPVLDKPPVFNAENADKSVLFMHALLNSQGYFRDSIRYDTVVKIKSGDQHRTIVNFTVYPGKPVLIDSLSYSIKQSELEALTKNSLENALVKKGQPFAKSAISAEMDRLVDLYRNNGYMRFGREEMIGIWDTLNPAILNPSLDPFEQILLLDSIRKSRASPKANLEIMLKPGFDSSKLTKYYVGDIEIFPDLVTDTSGFTLNHSINRGIKISNYKNIFKPKIFPANIFLKKGEVYSQLKYLKTINRFNSLGSWRLVNILPKLRYDSDTADFTIKLTPAKKYSFNTNLETSRNYNAFSGNLFGIAVNFSLQNRNFAKAAIQTVTNLRYNIETGKDATAGVKFIQTRQIILSHTIYFPRPIPRSNFIPASIRENFRTVLSFNAGITERRNLYNLNTLNGAWGYEFKWNKKFITLRIPNIEYAFFDSKPKLDSIFIKNPSLRNIFTNGFIESYIATMSVNGGKNKYINSLRLNVEKSGLLTPLIKKNNFLDTNLYRFLKFDADFTQKFTFKKSSFVWRTFAGVGIESSNTVNPNKQFQLPFFRQYFAGGPNSMRAWSLRRLGPGSKLHTDTLIDNFGDVQFETNLEYRFPLFIISGVKVNGAIFSDIGNVWLLKKSPNTDDKEVFNFSRLGYDLAVSTGLGMRLDFDSFVIRLDYAYKAKDPSPIIAAAQNKWFYGAKLLSGQLQLGISYPFIQ